MKDRILGQSGTKISALGIGAMSFSDFYGKSSTEISHSILSASLDLDINHIDTADIYGMGSSEERIGSFLKRNPSAKNYFKIASKGSIARSSDGKTFFDNSNVLIIEFSFKNSLKSLDRFSIISILFTQFLYSQLYIWDALNFEKPLSVISFSNSSICIPFIIYFIYDYYL